MVYCVGRITYHYSFVHVCLCTNFYMYIITYMYMYIITYMYTGEWLCAYARLYCDDEWRGRLTSSLADSNSARWHSFMEVAREIILMLFWTCSEALHDCTCIYVVIMYSGTNG